MMNKPVPHVKPAMFALAMMLAAPVTVQAAEIRRSRSEATDRLIRIADAIGMADTRATIAGGGKSITNGEITAGLRRGRHRVTTTAVMTIIMTIVGHDNRCRVTIYRDDHFSSHPPQIITIQKKPGIAGCFFGVNLLVAFRRPARRGLSLPNEQFRRQSGELFGLAQAVFDL
ncbi:hypothetical protein ACNKHO_00025 [Shigella flexneri]